MILINVGGGNDDRVWPYNKNGSYSAKSGYHKLKEEIVLVNERPTSSHRVDEMVWKIIWQLKVPSKIQIFLWRACSNAIPVRWLLWKRRVVESPICSVCNIEEESVEHLMLGCEWTRGVWFECCPGMRICREEISTVDVWLLKIYTELKGRGQERIMNDIAYVSWQIWKIRCEMVIQRKEVSIHKAIDRIKKAIAEFYSLKKDLLGDEKKKGKGCEKVMEKWRKPEIGWRKINCDGALDLKTKEARAGVIVRDYKGKVVVGKC